MKDVSDILAKRLLRLESPFSRDWLSDFSNLMEFIQTNPLTTQVVESIREKKEEAHASLIHHLKALLEDGKKCLQQIETKAGKNLNELRPQIQALLAIKIDRIQKRVSQMYDDKLDGLIDEKMYLDKARDYKTRQAEIVEQMGRHEKADENFYVTTNMVMNLAARAREIFESSEVDEKRQLLNLVFQNLKLEGKSLSIDTCEPFTTLVDYKKSPKGWGQLDSNQRRPKSRDLQSLAIAARRYPRRKKMLTVGIEPTTVRLQVGCSTN